MQGIREVLGLSQGEPIPRDTIHAVKMGTTVATNALLERKGERTCLLITKGFGNLQRIGYQNRPDLFALDIRLPDLLYSDVAEIDERPDAEGRVIAPLDLVQAREVLCRAYGKGYRSVAIALLHSYCSAEHEKALGEMAQQQGFTQVSLSHEASAMCAPCDIPVPVERVINTGTSHSLQLAVRTETWTKRLLIFEVIRTQRVTDANSHY